MIGLDTNVLVRYLAQDDKGQAGIASQSIEARLSERSPGFISLVMLVELCWVLQKPYGATTRELGGMVTDLLATPQFKLQIERRCRRRFRLFGPRNRTTFDSPIF